MFGLFECKWWLLLWLWLLLLLFNAKLRMQQTMSLHIWWQMMMWFHQRLNVFCVILLRIIYASSFLHFFFLSYCIARARAQNYQFLFLNIWKALMLAYIFSTNHYIHVNICANLVRMCIAYHGFKKKWQKMVWYLFKLIHLA